MFDSLFGQVLVVRVLLHGVFFTVHEKLLGDFGELLLERGVADFALEEVLIGAVRLLAVERQRVLALVGQQRVVAVERPVAGGDGLA